MTERVFAAVDLGASGGRVMAGIVGPDTTVALVPVHRFANEVTERRGHLRWDICELRREILEGLRRLCADFPTVESIGVDTWGVDYGLLDSSGALLSDPIAYRDDRTSSVIEKVHAVIPPRELFDLNGLQFLPFTTLYQLAAERRSATWSDVGHVVLLPDLIAYWLTGVLATEYTNASTTGLLDIRRRAWSSRILDAIGLPDTMLPPLVAPGSHRGGLLDEVAAAVGARQGLPVVNVASHDTASAVVAIPGEGSFAYVVSGTWSLVGVETDRPLVGEDTRAARFTNEAGVDGTTRLLRNVGGLWLLQECLRTWNESGVGVEMGDVLDEAAHVEAGPTFAVDDERFIVPNDMPARIAAAIAETGATPPSSPAETVRCILDSLSNAHAAVLGRAERLTGRRVDTVHVVGGGSQNALLCQLTANATGRPVVAGPVETTALGNVAIQARAAGALPASLAEVRSCIAASHELTTYEPRRLTAAPTGSGS